MVKRAGVAICDPALCVERDYSVEEKRYSHGKITPYILILPEVILLFALVLGLITAFQQSLGYLPSFDMYDLTFDYYIKVLTDSSLIQEIARSIAVSMVAAILTAIVGVVLSRCLVTVSKGKGIVSQIVKLPMLIPYSVCAVLTVFMFSQTGVLPRILEALGVPGAQDLFSQILYMPNSIGIVIVFVFHASSFFTYMVVGTMSQISDTLGEAALNLGVSPWQSFIHVTLPHCMPAIRNTFIFVFVIFFGSYEVPLLVGNALVKLLPVQAYLDYSNFNIPVYRPEAMVLNMIMLVIAALVVLTIHLWDSCDRKKRGVM